MKRAMKRDDLLQPQDREAGFILPVVMVALAVISLSIWAALSALESTRKDLSDLRADIRLQRTALVAEARVAYLLATEPLGAAGLRQGARRYRISDEFSAASESSEPVDPLANVLRFDNRAYEMSLGSDTVAEVRLQDEAGLLNLNILDQVALERLLRNLGAKEEAARQLAATLHDFIDADDLKRLNGAEASEYERAGQMPPPNRDLNQVSEAFSAFGWSSELPAGAAGRLAELTSTASATTPFNLNTAPQDVLRAWFDLTEDEAATVIRARETSLLVGPTSLTSLTGRPAQPSDFRLYAFPGRSIRLSVRLVNEPRGATHISWIRLAEAGDIYPYFVLGPEIDNPSSKFAERANEQDEDTPPRPFPFPVG
ncbi:MAG: hypothetical protein GC152_09415 [Alphaproteobacteria bacterium]|nr:hypothetical protein [Alphaproteobacteria bacterium]